ncbi:Disease resistance protein-like protein [Drosera capensis]
MALSCFGDFADAGCFRKAKRTLDSPKSGYAFATDDGDEAFPEGVRVFSYRDIEKATQGFKTLLGKGGFASVYHGVLADGTQVAVKWFNEKRSTFHHVVKILAGIRHQNVARVIGCCIVGNGLMVYEFMERGNLSSLLFDSEARISWTIRADICRGVARGLAYLHEGISPPVVHRDIKSQNILLDKDLRPKISGFSLAEVIDDNSSGHSGEVCGTFGYLDPDYCAHGRITKKLDVYSFGVVLLEIISGRRAIQRTIEDSHSYNLVELVWKLWESNNLLDIVDPNLLFYEDREPKEVLKFLKAALFCVQESSRRLRMSEVVFMLSGSYDFSQMQLMMPTSWFRRPYPHSPGSVVSYISCGLSYGRTTKQDSEVLETKESLPGLGDSTHKFPDIEGHFPPPLRKQRRRRAVEWDVGKGLDFIRTGGTSFKASPPPVVVDEDDVGSLGETELKILDPSPIVPTFGEWTSSQPLIDLETANEELTKVSIDMIGVSSARAVGEIEADVASFTTEASTRHSIEEERTCPVSDSATASKSHTQPDSAPPPLPPASATDSKLYIQPDSRPPPHRASATVSIADHQAIQADIVVNRHKKPNETDDSISLPMEAQRLNKVLSASNVDISWSIGHVVQEILDLLKDAQVSKVGLYGKGGIGKTTVLRALRRHPEIQSLFDLVLWVTIPRYSCRTKIQEQISQQLSSTTEDENANVIQEQMLNGKKFLLLLDDVRAPIDLHETGQGRSWRVVLTSRDEKLCFEMAGKVLDLKALSRVEAWSLFQSEAGEIVDHPEIEPYARTFVEECVGLPLLITIIGRSLRMETKAQKWKLALRQFLSPHAGNAGDPANLQLRFVFDRLEAPDIMSCFLCCALFPEYEPVDVSKLVNYFMDEGLLIGAKATAFKRGLDIVWRLADASLLEVAEDNSTVKMHELARGLALAILSADAELCRLLLRSEVKLSQPQTTDKETVQSLENSTRAFEPVESPRTSLILSSETREYMTLAGAELKEPPVEEEWEEARVIVLSGNKLSRLPVRPMCNRLSVLLLQKNYNLRVIPSSFFDLMPSLRILDLSKTKIKSLPQSFTRLGSLQVLLLRDCVRLMVFPSEIGSVKRLEVLDLHGTEITHLPDTVSKLSNLRHLQLSFYGSDIRSDYVKLPTMLIPDGIIRNLNLTELGISMFPGDHRWFSTALGVTKEVCCLELNALSFPFPDMNHLRHLLEESLSWKRGTLRKYNFVVGRDVKRIVSQVSSDVELMYSQQDRCLRFVNGEEEPRIPDAILKVLKQATAFYMDHCVGICFLSEFGISNLRELKLCIVRDCPNFESLVNDDEFQWSILPDLETLSLNYLWNLKKIWIGRIPSGSLSLLRHLSVRGCPRLTSLFSSRMIETLSCLEELVVEDCESLKNIISEDEALTCDSRVDSSVSVLHNLKMLKLQYLPALSGIWEGPWPPLKYISVYACPVLQNLRLDSIAEASLREIKAEGDWWIALKWDDPAFKDKLQARVVEIHDGDL